MKPPKEDAAALPEGDVTALSEYFDADGTRQGLAYSGDQVRALLAAQRKRWETLSFDLIQASMKVAAANDLMSGVVAAATVYFTHYMQDEANDEDDLVCGREQHERAKALRDALKLLEPNNERNGHGLEK